MAASGGTIRINSSGILIIRSSRGQAEILYASGRAARQVTVKPQNTLPRLTPACLNNSPLIRPSKPAANTASGAGKRYGLMIPARPTIHQRQSRKSGSRSFCRVGCRSDKTGAIFIGGGILTKHGTSGRRSLSGTGFRINIKSQTEAATTADQLPVMGNDQYCFSLLSGSREGGSNTAHIAAIQPGSWFIKKENLPAGQ